MNTHTHVDAEIRKWAKIQIAENIETKKKIFFFNQKPLNYKMLTHCITSNILNYIAYEIV